MRRNYQTVITSHEPRMKVGSALILTVVLTSLLAIVGVLFVLASRVEKIATEATAENRELNLAIDTVIAAISQELVRDTPGVAGQEYYDYPDVNNIWLASLEPSFDDKGTPAPADDQYYWRQISDVTGYLRRRGLPTQGIVITDSPPDPLLHAIIAEYNPIVLDPNGDPCDKQLADADGDAIADAKWIELEDVTTGQGEPIYAAIRVIDNESMLNVNTGYKFDPNVVDPNGMLNLLDGSSPLQINLLGLSGRPVLGVPPYDLIDDTDLLSRRANGAGVDPTDLVALLDYLLKYESNVVWKYQNPTGSYTPFDISDELELRYRFLLNHESIDTRLEDWGGEFRNSTSSTPFLNLAEWFISAYDDPVDGVMDPNYAYRRLATIYNMDRIIDPNGDKMINVNDGNVPVWLVYDRLLRSMRPAFVPDPNIRWRLERECAQLAVNMVDFADNDANVTILTDPCGFTYYGFDAQPFITELGMYFVVSRDYELNLDYYVLELYNPFDRFIDLNDFVLELYDPKTSLFVDILFPPADRIAPNDYYVMVNDAGAAAYFPIPFGSRVDPRLRFFSNWVPPDKSKPVVDFRENPDKSLPPIYFGWKNSYILYLKRIDIPGPPIYVDQQIIDPTWIIPAMSAPAAFGRDIRNWHVIYQTPVQALPTFGLPNFFDPNLSLAHNFSFFLPNPLRPRSRLVTIGDIPRILSIGNNITRNSTIGEQLWSTPKIAEATIRLNLQDPYHRDVFQYLTVFDPTSDNIDNDGDGTTDANDRSEWKVPGRININTAPWYVTAQLPWMTGRLAQTVVAYRDKVGVTGIVDYSGPLGRQNATGVFGLREAPGLASTGELNFIIGSIDNTYNIGLHALDGVDLIGFPDLTTNSPVGPFPPGDEVIDDFEERDVIFSRISNLVTVRSDVFTAYILVRIGTDGPQKRVIAILDRSGVYTGKAPVRLVALHDVPDPR